MKRASSEDDDGAEAPELIGNAGRLDLALVCGLAILPAVAVALVVSSWTAVALGAAAWGVALIVKAVVHWVGAARFQRSEAMSAGWAGMLSGLTELGIAAVVFSLWTGWSTADVVAVGIGAGSAETAFVVAEALASKPVPEIVAAWSEGARRSIWVRHTFVVERAVAYLQHVGARGLIAAAIFGHIWWPAAIALAVFSTMDAVAEYGQAKGWNWYDPPLHHKYFGALFVAGCSELVLMSVLLNG